jgi:7-cyano-7-deazaguanine synthase
VLIHQAIVLLSGGLDSTAALLWARGQYKEVHAVMFDYGQPNRDQELTAAGRACTRLGISRSMHVLADALPRSGILAKVVDHDGREDGSSPAIVHGRNALFAVSASAHGSLRFPNGNMALVLGCNAQDARRFPDCHPVAMLRLGEMLRVCIAREIQIVVPWIDRTKEQMLRGFVGDAEATDILLQSWSCYRDVGPCGTCSACVLRHEAIVKVGLADRCMPIKMHGGDPQRDTWWEGVTRDRVGG